MNAHHHAISLAAAQREYEVEHGAALDIVVTCGLLVIHLLSFQFLLRLGYIMVVGLGLA